MSNDARFEFVLIDGGSQQSDSSAVTPRERDDLRDLLESILNRAGVQLPQGSTPTPTPQPTVKPTEVLQPTPAPETKSPDVGAVPVPSPTSSPVPSPTPTPQPQPLPTPREAAHVEVPKTTDVTGRMPESIPRAEPVAVPKPEPRPEPKPLPTPEPRRPEPLPPPSPQELTPTDRQPTEPSKVPERFVNYPQKEIPTPITQTDLDAMKRDYGKPYDAVRAAEDLARQESADRMRKLAEEMNAERDRKAAERAAKSKADHERAMANSDEAIRQRYDAPDAKKIFEELRADAKKAVDLKYGPSPIDRTGDIIEAIAVEGKDAAKATAAAATGKLAETVGKAAAGAGSAGAAGGAAGGAAAGGALAGLAASAATGTLAGLAVSAPAMIYRSIEQYTDKLTAALGDLSPEIAMAQARADTAMTFRRLELARQLGPDLAKTVEADSDMRIAGSRVAGAFIGPIVRDFADFKKGMGDVVEQLGKFVDNNRSFFEQVTEGAIDASGFGWVGDLGRFLTWMTGGGDQQQTFGTFLDDLDFITPPGWDQAPASEPEDWGVLFR